MIVFIRFIQISWLTGRHQEGTQTAPGAQHVQDEELAGCVGGGDGRDPQDEQLSGNY